MTNHMVRDEDGRFPKAKFDLSTPKRGSHAYCRILHPVTGGVPSSHRILRDVDKVFESMAMVMKAQGIKIDGLGNRKGKRQEESPCQETRGGKRTKKKEPKTETWL